MLAALSQAGFDQPTEVQSQAIGLVIKGHDLIASAQTGSGKTAAYALPIIHRLQLTERSAKPKALILVPTRELALQVKEQFVRFGSGLRTAVIYGGTSVYPQQKALKRGAEVIVATPGRLLDLIKQGCADLRHVEMLVLDEADRLMDMGFMPQVRKVIGYLPSQRQTLMFSATIDKRIEQLANEYLTNPQIVRSTCTQVDAASITQNVHYMKEFAKEDFLLQLLGELDQSSVLIFTRTRRKASWVADRLRKANVTAEEIHSDVSQSKREKIMRRYREGDFTVLVATDVASRGLDVPSIGHVINYDLPDCAQDYVHRIGRSGRAGRSGVAHSLVSNEQRYLLRDIERLIGRKLDDTAQTVSADTHKPSMSEDKHKPSMSEGKHKPSMSEGKHKPSMSRFKLARAARRRA